mgnify:CR=1 FL=1
MSTQLFGTGGIRGVANQWPITPEVALRIGRAVARVLAANGQKRHKVVIGKDTRLSGYMLENAITTGDGIMSALMMLSMMRRHTLIFLQFTLQTGHPHSLTKLGLKNYSQLLKEMNLSKVEINKRLNSLPEDAGVSDNQWKQIQASLEKPPS